VFEHLQPLDVGGLQPAVLGFPLVVGGGTDPALPPDLVDRATGIGFFQHRHNLRFGELRLAHGNLLAGVAIVPEDSPFDLSTFRESLQGGSMIRLAFLEGSPSLRARHILPILTKQFKITYITSGTDIPQGDFEQVIRFPKAKVHMQHTWAYSRAAERLYAEGKIDFVYTYHAIGCFLRRAPELALFGASFVEDARIARQMTPWYLRPKWAMGYLHYAFPEILTCRHAKKVLANSEALRHQLEEIHGLETKTTGVVRNGVTKEAIAIFSQKKLHECRDILFVGRLHRRKGILPLIDAFMERIDISARLLIIGDGPQLSRIRELAKRDTRIVPLGAIPQEKVFEIMKSTLFYVWPALHEGFPNAFAEALASGHASVYYDIPANRELAGETGIPTPVGQPELLLTALENLIKNREQSIALAEAAHLHVRQFTWETCAANLAKELREFPQLLSIR
jgi:glycosyltransferase involved in cell wall biosynthesis